MTVSLHAHSQAGHAHRCHRARRVGRAFAPDTSPMMRLDPRILAAAVWYLTPGDAQAQNTAISRSQVIPANGGAGTVDTEANTGVSQGGAGVTSSAGADYINVAPVPPRPMGGGGGRPGNSVQVQENGSANVTTGMPTTTQGSGENLSAIQIHGVLMNTDSVQTDANGPYGVNNSATSNGAGQRTEVDDGAGDNFTIANSNGAPVPGNETVTVSFSSSTTAPDTSRYTQIPAVSLNTPYFWVRTPGDDGVVDILPPGGGTPILTGNLSGFSFSGTYPIVTGNNAVAYDAILQTGPNGQFGQVGAAESTSHTYTETFDVVMAINGP